MTPAMIASLARSLQKCSGSSSSRSFRCRAMSWAAKGPRVYTPARGLHVEGRNRPTHRIRHVVDRDRFGDVREIVQAIPSRPQFRRRNPLVDVAVNDEARPTAEQDRLERLASEFGTPFLLLSAHRDVGRRIMSQEDPAVVPRQEVVQGPDPSTVLFRKVRHMLPLPPGRSVEAPEAADDPDLGSVRGKPRVVILEESDLVPVGETGDVRRMIVGILVVP